MMGTRGKCVKMIQIAANFNSNLTNLPKYVYKALEYSIFNLVCFITNYSDFTLRTLQAWPQISKSQ